MQTVVETPAFLGDARSLGLSDAERLAIVTWVAANPVAGDVIVVPFPQTDLKAGKPRPALVLVELPGDDLILAQITSQLRHDGFSIPLISADFAKGNLPLASYIRPNRIFTVDKAVVLRTAGQVRPEKLQTVLAAVRQIFS